MPNVIVIQGLKMSSLLYTLFTLDTLQYDKIVLDPGIYKLLTGKTLRKYNKY